MRLTPDGPAVVSQFTLCHGCVDGIQTQLNELPHLALALATMKGTWGGVSYEARVSGSKEAPSPLHVGIVDLVDEVWNRIDDAEGYRIVDLVTRPPESWVIGGRTVTRDGVDRALDIRHVHRRASEAVGFEKVWERRAAACPECLLPTLGGWVGDDLISCSECLAAFTKKEYENLCFAQSKG